MKGTIALDIDGTITNAVDSIPAEVVHYLAHLNAAGWQLIFITGRTFSLGYKILKALPFPYYFAVQNGALILEMPSQRILTKKYLGHDILPAMEDICDHEPTDFVIYAGYEHNDHCYYRPEHFDKELFEYLKYRQQLLSEVWEPVKSFANLPIASFPSVKCFGKLDSIERIIEKIEDQLDLHVPPIKDPFNPAYFIAQATHPEINKGQALKDFIKTVGKKGPVIAAGDDNNDRTMLEAAEIKVVMATAPNDLLELADIIAPPAEEHGIIKGLEIATTRTFL